MTISVKIIILTVLIAIIWYSLANKETLFDFLKNNESPDTITDLPLDEQLVKEVFEMKLEAMKNCNTELANTLITEESKEIIRFTCSNMTNERKCYINKTTIVRIKENKATLYFPPFNHGSGWPFFFTKENGQWKIDYYEMSNGITMLGSGCNTGWAWRREETRDKFCNFFPTGECPDKSR